MISPIVSPMTHDAVLQFDVWWRTSRRTTMTSSPTTPPTSAPTQSGQVAARSGHARRRRAGDADLAARPLGVVVVRTVDPDRVEPEAVRARGHAQRRLDANRELARGVDVERLLGVALDREPVGWRAGSRGDADARLELPPAGVGDRERHLADAVRRELDARRRRRDREDRRDRAHDGTCASSTSAITCAGFSCSTIRDTRFR